MSPDSVSARETSVHLVPTAGWDGQLPPEELPGAWEPFLALRPERLASDQDCFVRPETFAAVGSELRAWDPVHPYRRGWRHTQLPETSPLVEKK